MNYCLQLIVLLTTAALLGAIGLCLLLVVGSIRFLTITALCAAVAMLLYPLQKALQQI